MGKTYQSYTKELHCIGHRQVGNLTIIVCDGYVCRVEDDSYSCYVLCSQLNGEIFIALQDSIINNGNASTLQVYSRQEC